MGKGTNTTTASSSADPQAAAAYRDLITRASQVASTPYQAYSGQLTAPINAQQQTAIGNINANAGFAQPYIQQAAGFAADAANPISASDIQQYINPYTQNVVDATQAQFDEQNQQAQQGLLSKGIAQGALGGNRMGVAQANLAGQQATAQAPVIAGLQSQGYQQALAAAQADAQRKQAAAYSLGNLGVSGQNAALSGATAQLGAGTLEQQTQQAANTAQYGQYMQQQAYPFQTLQWLAGLQTGVGSQLGGTSSTTQPQPNQAAQWLGLGVSALGLLSDERAKEDIEHIGKMNDGQNIYRYRYKGSPEWHIGPIAQEVERKHPESVTPGVAGLKFVDVKGATDDAARAVGGFVPHYAGGGEVPGMPWDAAQGWVPKMNITGGRGAPGAPSPAKEQSGVNADGIMKAAQGLAGLGSKFSGEAYGGGNIFNSEWGGSSSNPLPGLDASDYGPGFRRGGSVPGFATGGTPFDDRFAGDGTTPGYDAATPPTVVGDAVNPFDPIQMPPDADVQAWRDANPLPGPDGKPAGFAPTPPVVAQDDGADLPPNAAPAGPTAPVSGLAPSPAPAGEERTGLLIPWTNAERAALIAGGLGMLASRSPNLGNAIGEGGLAGFGTYAGVKKGEADAAKSAAELAQKANETAKRLALDTRKQDETERHNKATEGREFKPTYGVIGEDPTTGAKIYGWIDPNKQTTTAPTNPVGARGPSDPNLSGEAYLASLPPQQAGLVKAVAEYKVPYTALSLRRDQRERILAAAARYNPDFDATTYGVRAKAVKDFGTGVQGNTVRSLDVAIDHLNTLDGAAKALQNGDLGALNKIRNYFRQQTGSELPGNFDAIKGIVGAEIAKAVVGGQTALHDREEAARLALNSNSPAQLAGVILKYKQLMAGQLHGLKKQYEDSTGLKNFDKKLRPSTLHELESAAAAEHGGKAYGSNLPPPKERKVGTVYATPKGPAKWMGNGWQPVK